MEMVGVKGDKMPPAEVGRRIEAMEARPRSAQDDNQREFSHRSGSAVNYDYMLDDNRVIRHHSGKTEAYVTFLQDGARTEKIGHVARPTEQEQEMAARETIYTRAKTLHPRTLMELYAIEQKVYTEMNLADRAKKRRRGGMVPATPTGPTPAGRAPRTPTYV